MGIPTWQEFDFSDIKPELMGTFEMIFTCPRCSMRQLIKINAPDLMSGESLLCVNPACNNGDEDTIHTMRNILTLVLEDAYYKIPNRPLIQVFNTNLNPVSLTQPQVQVQSATFQPFAHTTITLDVPKLIRFILNEMDIDQSQHLERWLQSRIDIPLMIKLKTEVK